jgi:hypothetical protein
VPSLKHPLLAWVTRFAAKLRFPQLFLLTAALFLLDLAIPDAIPFADELLLGLAALLLAGRRRPAPPAAAPPRA